MGEKGSGNGWKFNDVEYIDYFMESARVRYSHELLTYQKTNASERSERVSFLIQKRVRKYRTKHFPCCNLFIS